MGWTDWMIFLGVLAGFEAGVWGYVWFALKDDEPRNDLPL